MIADQHLEKASHDAELSKGLTSSPLLLRQVYHAAGNYSGKDDGIAAVALGAAIVMVGVYWDKKGIVRLDL